MLEGHSIDVSINIFCTRLNKIGTNRVSFQYDIICPLNTIIALKTKQLYNKLKTVMITSFIPEPTGYNILLSVSNIEIMF
jgi:hypothetical protein